jgi:excisionase family DNA binding protein
MRMSNFLTISQVAERLRMHSMTVYKMAQEGKLPAIKIGGRWKIDEVRLSRWIAEQEEERTRRALVVDQDEHIRTMFEGLSQTIGCEVVFADDVRAAQEHLQTEGPFDVIFVECKSSPGTTGQLLAAFKKFAPHTPVVLTAEADELFYVDNLRRYSPAAVMMKPLDWTMVKTLAS